jgi:hypothetical protein
MAFLKAVSFFEIFFPNKLIKNSNSLGDILAKFLYNPLTDGKFKSASKIELLYNSLLVYSCLCYHRRSFLSFYLKRNIYIYIYKYMYRATANCKDITQALITNWKPYGVTLAGYS